MVEQFETTGKCPVCQKPLEGMKTFSAHAGLIYHQECFVQQSLQSQSTLRSVPFWGGFDPICNKCKMPMTPANSRLRPELFFCDVCLPEEFKDPAKAWIGPSKVDTLAEHQAKDKTVGAALLSVTGLVMDVTGTEIIEHCRAKADYYRTRVEERRRREEVEEQRRQAVLSNLKNDPMCMLPGFPSYTNHFGLPPDSKLKFFEFIAAHVSNAKVYRLSLDELDRLEWCW